MADVNKPRRGSLGYKPKSRNERPYATIETYRDEDETVVQGFAGYKAGMTRVLMVDDEEGPTKGRETATPVTVIEAPPIRIYGARFYTEDPNEGKKVLTEAWTDSPSTNLQRATNIPKQSNLDNIEEAKEKSDEVTEVRLLAHTQPQKTGFGKKTPENFEMGIGGSSIEEKIEFAEEKIGKQVSFSDLFEPGEYTDVVSVTKGKGFEGPVQRHGVTKLNHKTQKKRRKAGNVGPWHPDKLSWKVPLPGGDGYNKRTEENKRIIGFFEDPDEIQKEGGYKNYGELESETILIKGSVPGSTKRLIRFRKSLKETEHPGEPEITYIDG